MHFEHPGLRKRLGARMGIHLIFWVLYLVWEMYAYYIYFSNSVKGYHFFWDFIMDMPIILLALVPKLLVAYLVIVFPLQQASLVKKITARNIFLICATLMVGVIMYRAIAYFLVYPYYLKADLSKLVFFSQAGLASALVDIIIPVSLLVSLEFYHISREAKEKESRLEKEKLLSELSFLKAQTNPHFLFNTLSSIYGLAKNQAPKAADAILRLSKLLRFMLTESEVPFINIRDEIKFLEDYIELQKMRFGNRLTITLDTEIDDDFASIAPLILLPFVENAFKHGAGESSFASFIRIRAILKKNEFDFTISNSMEKKDIILKPGIGLRNIARRLELLYPNRQLLINNNDHQFTVSIKLNLYEYEKNELYSDRRRAAVG